ncbi:MAG: putative molybdenum carrier protein [Acidiferrobacterales bacterium]|nr:putative molybdenum carrier protein [Acidiferrobacterales bacterium]
MCAAVRAHSAGAPARIISGGQTGVDRAALDIAIELGIPCGGWCPHGRKAEDGVIPAIYPLTETSSAEYAPRTARNVYDADATLILACGPPTGGTALTVEIARRAELPCLIVDLEQPPAQCEVRRWLKRHATGTLNVAGPRESGCPGIYDKALAFLRTLLQKEG